MKSNGFLVPSLKVHYVGFSAMCCRKWTIAGVAQYVNCDRPVDRKGSAVFRCQSDISLRMRCQKHFLSFLFHNTSHHFST